MKLRKTVRKMPGVGRGGTIGRTHEYFVVDMDYTAKVHVSAIGLPLYTGEKQGYRKVSREKLVLLQMVRLKN